MTNCSRARGRVGAALGAASEFLLSFASRGHRPTLVSTNATVMLRLVGMMREEPTRGGVIGCTALVVLCLTPVDTVSAQNQTTAPAARHLWSTETVVSCALELLRRPPNTLPPIVVADRPPDASRDAVAFVRTGMSMIFLVRDGATLVEAQHASRRCGALAALRSLAGMIIHEEWHVNHGGDERGAYQAQLLVLMSLGAENGSSELNAAMRAMRTALDRNSRASPPAQLRVSSHARAPGASGDQYAQHRRSTSNDTPGTDSPAAWEEVEKLDDSINQRIASARNYS